MQYRVGKTHCQDPSKRVSIFLGTHEALIKMVLIYPVPISRVRTVSLLVSVASERSLLSS